MTNPETTDLLVQVLGMLSDGHSEQALEALSTLLPVDKVTVFRSLDAEARARLVSLAAPGDLADILEGLDDDEAAALAEGLDGEVLVQVVDAMEPDEAADLLGDLDAALRLQTLERLAAADDVRPLLSYPDDSAGGIMTSGYYAYRETDQAGHVLRSIRERPRLDEEIPYVYAIDERGRLVGVTRLADLIRAHPEQQLQSIARTEIVSIPAEEDQETAARLLQRYDLMALPVLDAIGRLVGVITADDAMAALEVEASEDIYKGAGILSVHGREAARSDLLVHGPLWQTWWVRIPILVVTLVGGMVAGAIVGVYEDLLEAITILAFFIPVIMDMGGGIGVQSTAVFIRGHALGQIDMQRFRSHLLREFAIGLGMSTLLGTMAGLVAAVWQGIPRLGLVVGLAMMCAMTLAATLGFVIPYVLLKLGMDPAAGSDPLITTIKDITGLLIYFSLSLWLLGGML